MKLSNPCSQCGETRYPLTHGICPKCQKREYRKGPCSHPGCHRKRTRRDLCGVHVKEYLAQGKFTLMDQSPKTCTILGCDKPHKGRGLCQMHYKRVRNRENPNFNQSKSRDYTSQHPEHVGIDLASKDGEFTVMSISTITLCERSGIPKNALVPTLKKLQEDGIISSFSVSKEIATLKIPSRYETFFSAKLNSKPPEVL